MENQDSHSPCSNFIEDLFICDDFSCSCSLKAQFTHWPFGHSRDAMENHRKLQFQELETNIAAFLRQFGWEPREYGDSIIWTYKSFAKANSIFGALQTTSIIIKNK